METGRGKKRKKAGWKLTLGLKETICAGIGVVGLMMMSFALGALAGRGDIYRAAYSWGLMSPQGAKVAQWAPVTGWPPATAPAPAGTAFAPSNRPSAAAPAHAVAKSTPAAAADKSKTRPLVVGSITPLSPPAATATARKKGKTTGTHRDHKARQEELQRVRQEVVRKLKFQNSFDSAPKARLPRLKEHEKAQGKSGGAKTQQVRVARYRSSKQAQAKVAELRKQGVKATIKKTRDSKGTWYIVYKSESRAHADTERLARKPQRSPGIVKKRKPE